MISRYPWNLQVIPYHGTECAIKKQMSPIFKSDLMTKDAIMVISNMPVSPDKHIFCVDSILQHQPSKELMFRVTFAFPNPTGRLIRLQMIESMLIHLGRSKANRAQLKHPGIIDRFREKRITNENH
jgi:hypothetical protein